MSEVVDFSSGNVSTESSVQASVNDLELLATANSRYRRIEESQLTDEERERLMLRRERNKQAAARCRNRRRDMTNTLEQQAEDWQQKNCELENEIEDLMNQKEQLELLLNMHEAHCSRLFLASDQQSHSTGRMSNDSILADSDDDYRMARKMKQEPQDLSLKGVNVSRCSPSVSVNRGIDNTKMQLPSNLIINPIASSALITNNNTHYYISQYNSAPQANSSSLSLNVPSNESSHYPSILTSKKPNQHLLKTVKNSLLVEVTTASHPQPMIIHNQQPVSPVVSVTVPGNVTPSKRVCNSGVSSNFSPGYASPGVNRSPVAAERTPEKNVGCRGGGGPLLSDSPRAMQKQLQQVQYGYHQSQPQVQFTSSRYTSDFVNSTALGETSLSLLEEATQGHSLINELFEDQDANSVATKHFSAL